MSCRASTPTCQAAAAAWALLAGDLMTIPQFPPTACAQTSEALTDLKYSPEMLTCFEIPPILPTHSRRQGKMDTIITGAAFGASLVASFMYQPHLIAAQFSLQHWNMVQTFLTATGSSA